VADIASDVFGAVTGLINDAIDLINNGIPNSLGKGPFKIDLPNNPIPHVPGNARGTDDWPGGWSWVGEQGPELVNLPRHAQVVPADQSAAMAAGGGALIHVEHQYVQPHDYNQFRREQEADARVASLGSRRPGSGVSRRPVLV
jgi:phage-related protein